jgi:3-deoxy-7-phosphoheptulonate synthase
LRLARALLLEVAEASLPAATEFLDIVIPQYLAGLISWGAIGARTTESQVHRQLVSGLSCPVGFKNGTSGDVQVAVEAVQSAAHPHCFLGHTKYGQSAIFATTGNPNCHVILRGGKGIVNYTREAVADACVQLTRAALPPRVMIDCSHANCNKSYHRQSEVCRHVASQIREGEERVVGVMMESNLVAGSQHHYPGVPLVYGQSITDPCIGWAETLELLCLYAESVQMRRQRRAEQGKKAMPTLHRGYATSCKSRSCG